MGEPAPSTAAAGAGSGEKQFGCLLGQGLRPGRGRRGKTISTRRKEKIAICCTSMGFLGAAAPKRPFRPFWAVPKGPRAGARNIPWQSVPETPRARSAKPPHILGRDRRTAGPGRVGAPGTPCRIPSGIDKKQNNSWKSWRAVVDHNFTATCRRTMTQGFAHFPQSFPHRYVNSVPDKKVRETGGRPVSQVRYSRSRITP